MLFWAVSIVVNYWAASGVILWYFIVPDAVHTAVLGEYVWVWARRMREEATDMLSI